MTKTFRLGTRATPLALEQSRLVGAHLEQAGIEVILVPLSSSGDRSLGGVLPQGKGAFTSELSDGIRQDEIDGAVHSLKDLPVEDEPGLTVVAIPERAAANDLLLVQRNHPGKSFRPLLELLADRTVCSTNPPVENLSTRAKLGTSSVRRQTSALTLRPDLVCVAVRGAVGTRLRTLMSGAVEALILAEAGLQRLADSRDAMTRPEGLSRLRAARLPLENWPCAPGQGALALQVAADSRWSTDDAILTLDHDPTRRAVTLERNALQQLQGGCQQPFGAWSPDGRRCFVTLSETSWRDRAAIGEAPRVIGANIDSTSLSELRELQEEARLSTAERNVPVSSSLGEEPDLVITTTASRARRLLGKLPSKTSSLALPLTRLVVFDTPWPTDVLDFDEPRRRWPYLLVSSPNVARVLIDRYETEPQWSTLAWCALGEGTARELLGAGFPASLVASARDGDQFADFVVAHLAAERPLLVPHSERSSGRLAERLRAAGRQVVDWPAYTVVSEKLSRWPAPIEVRPRSILLTAPSQVAALIDNQLELPGDCLAIGKTTGQALRDAFERGSLHMTDTLRLRIAEEPHPDAIAELWSELGQGHDDNPR